jgi:hypothetical protein
MQVSPQAWFSCMTSCRVQQSMCYLSELTCHVDEATVARAVFEAVAVVTVHTAVRVSL